MNRIFPVVLVVLFFQPLDALAQRIGPAQVPAMETFIQVTFQEPSVAFVVVREYALSSTDDDKGMARQVDRLEELVVDKRLLRQRFGLRNLTVLQEALVKDEARGIVVAEYQFGGQFEDRERFLEGLYAALLESDVSVGISADNVTLQFAEKNAAVKQQNGGGIFQRDDEVLVLWPADLQRLELLVGPAGDTKEGLRSLAPFLEASVASPPFLNDAGTYEPMQHDFDLARLQDLLVISDYIERYHAATGRFPLQGEAELPHYSIIATRQQQQYVPEVEIPHAVTPVGEFLDALQAVLGEELVLPFDPQQAPVNKPAFYVYRVEEEVWYVSVHLYEAFPFAAPLADHNNRLEVTNSVQRSAGQWLRDELLNDPEMKQALERTPHQPGYVDTLRKGLGGNAAF